MKAIRHGDLCLVKIDSLPTGLIPSASKTLMTGSHGNNHDVQNGTFFPKDVDQFVFGYLQALSKYQLVHPDHGKGKGKIKTAELEEGFYELRRQFEFTSDQMKPVVD